MGINETEGGSSFVQGLLIGGILGALAGLLFAPKSGKELRSELKQRGSGAIDDAKELYTETQMKAKDILEEAERRAEGLRTEIERRLADARLRAREILRRAEVREEAQEGMEGMKTESAKTQEAAAQGGDAAQPG